MMFDSGQVHLEFVVNRYDQVTPGSPITGKKVTGERMVIPLPGIIALVASLSSLLAGLTQQGIIQQMTPGQASQKLN